MKNDAQMAIASRRAEASAKMLRISDSVDGISMAPNTPSTARAATRCRALGAKAAATDTTAKPRGTDHQQAAPADPVAEAAHRHQQCGQHQRVDVDDPQLGGRGRAEVLGDARQRERQDGVVDGDQQHRQQQHRERQPRAARGVGGRRHDVEVPGDMVCS